MDLPGVGVEFEASTMDVKNLHRFIGKRLAGAKQTAELARVSDNRWSVSVGHTTAGFIFKAMAALFVGVAGLQLLFKVLNTFT